MIVNTFVLPKAFCPMMRKYLRDHELAMTRYPAGYPSPCCKRVSPCPAVPRARRGLPRSRAIIRPTRPCSFHSCKSDGPEMSDVAQGGGSARHKVLDPADDALHVLGLELAGGGVEILASEVDADRARHVRELGVGHGMPPQPISAPDAIARVAWPSRPVRPKRENRPHRNVKTSMRAPGAERDARRSGGVCWPVTARMLSSMFVRLTGLLRRHRRAVGGVGDDADR